MAVLSLLVAESLYISFPELEEGDLTRVRATLVRPKAPGGRGTASATGTLLAFWARGEERSGGRKKAVLLANMYEALVAALYLDAGPRDYPAHSCSGPRSETVCTRSAAEVAPGPQHGAITNPHCRSCCRPRKAAPPEYTVKAETGPDHRKPLFLVEVHIRPEEGSAAVRAGSHGEHQDKKAEQEAARLAYEEILQARPLGGGYEDLWRGTPFIVNDPVRE